jgi:UDP-N-acetylmuramyl pentapeptide phosphotransferase/UDP-N-acetylglucosamine-1-phosphate transferase
MNILIQFALFALNLAIGIMNYNFENYGLAMFNTTVAGACLGFFIFVIRDHRNEKTKT